MTTIATPSIENVRVRITETTGQVLDSTVELAIVPRKPTDADWHAAEWEGDPAAVRIARLLIGPGKLELTAGYYRVWYRLTDTPEVPVRQAGGLTIT